MSTSAEFEVDFRTRRVTAKILREFDVVPITITIPFATLKGIVAGIVATEAEAEKAAQNGGHPRLVSSPS